ncbi:hypothetical protein CGRA01v4_10373 [Colletotrichum graminicola]|nr:hypothetical protein CGRA01v4_10373 [Colletotrichum graminicola]
MLSESGDVEEAETLLVIRRQRQALLPNSYTRPHFTFRYRRCPSHSFLVSACGRPSPHDASLYVFTCLPSHSCFFLAPLPSPPFLPHATKLLAGNVAIAHATETIG